VNVKNVKYVVVLAFLFVAIVVILVVTSHPEQKDLVTVDKVELNGNLHHATVRSLTTQYAIFCQDIPEISCLQLHAGEKHLFRVNGTVLYFSDAPTDVEGGWRIDKEEKLN
jgi:hypothetical protein